jgi:hypothetical protein
VTPPAQALLIWVCIPEVTGGTAPTDPSSVAGWSLTWTKIGHAFVDNVFSIKQRVLVYAARTTVAPGSGTIVGTWAASNERYSGCIVAIDDADLSGGVAGAIVQTVTVDDNAGVDQSLTIVMADRANQLNRIFGATAHNNVDSAFPTDPSSNLATQVFNIQTNIGFASTSSLHWGAQDVDPTFTWSAPAARNGGVGFEVKTLVSNATASAGGGTQVDRQIKLERARWQVVPNHLKGKRL